MRSSVTGLLMRVDVVIPALNEAESLSTVLRAIPRPPVHSVWVVDNGSTDATAQVARSCGADVVSEPRRGYGSACLAGIAALPSEVDVVLFMDADGSDDPAFIAKMLGEIEAGADFVVAARTAPGGAGLSPQQRVGNAIAARWLRRRYGLPATDLGPFRAIRRDALARLQMTDTGYGWTVEMQIKAARLGLRYREVQVPARPRAAGTSKVSGTLRGVAGASVKILGLLALHDLDPMLRGAVRRLYRRASRRAGRRDFR